MLATLALLHAWILLQLGGLSAIAEANTLTRSAKQAYERGLYRTAATDYAAMADKLGQANDPVLANMGHAYFKAGDLGNATRAYTRLSLSQDGRMRSLAATQLGVIASRNNNYGEAATQFRQALKEDPNNIIARLNYERTLKRRPQLQPPNQKQQNKQDQQQQKEEKQQSEQQKQQQQDQQKGQGQNKEQQNPQQQQQGQSEQEKEKQRERQEQQQRQGKQPGQDQKPGGQGKDGKPEDADKGKDNEGQQKREAAKGYTGTRADLKKMQLPEDKARMLLEAMRSGEVQYLQQRRYRRQGKEAEDGKPDW